MTPRCGSRRPRRIDRRDAVAAALLLVGCLGAGCRPPSPQDGAAPLFSEDSAPDVLTEERLLEAPPSPAGNRLLTGWLPWREGGTLHLVAQGRRVRLQLVNLQARPRELVLQAPRLLEGPEGTRVGVLLGSWSVADMGPGAWSATLPPIDALGRVTVELGLEPGVSLAVDGVGVRGTLPAGHVVFEGGDVLQSGASLVDQPIETGGAAVLYRSFDPPSPARPGQTFRLLVESADGTEEAFRWQAGRLAALRGSRHLSVVLPEGPGLARIRLLAEGEGPPARWRGLTLARAPSPPPPAATPPKPPRMVLVYVMDALRADRLGALGGDPRATPVLDRLAREGVVFADHHSVAPNTLPSTKSLFTGRVTFDDAPLQRQGEGPTTLAQLYAESGYATGMFTGNGYVFHLASRGFEHREQKVLYTQYQSIGYNDNAGRAQAAALAWLDTLPPDHPVFLYIHPVNPHNPYEPPPDLEREWTAGIDSDIQGATDTLLAVASGEIPVDPADEERLEGLYQGGLAYGDRVLGPFLDELLDRYPDGELLAVLTSDHGEELFDHGGLLHGYTLHRELLRIPLTVWWPGRLQAGRHETPTDNLDVHYTLRQLVAPDAAPPDGALSLWPALLGNGSVDGGRIRFAAASSLEGGIFSAAGERWKLIWAPRVGAGWGQGDGIGRRHDAWELYDLEADPGELDNRAGTETLETAWLRSKLLAWIASHASPEAGRDTPVPDDLRRNLEALGYID
ncbi:MAG: sulfatase [Thermoanaerobaculia bacterium]